MASERATPNDEGKSAYGVRRLAAALGGWGSPSPESGSELPHSIIGGVSAGVAVTFTLTTYGFILHNSVACASPTSERWPPDALSPVCGPRNPGHDPLRTRSGPIVHFASVQFTA